MKRISLILIFIFTTSALSAQRVGLVLSGGGAKGLYHVGMIKALEENGIPIDYVSGASMGAIVGAMYVSGYSPDEMLSFFATDSVKTWLAGKIPDEYRYYFTKFSPTPEIISVKINPDTVKLLNILALPSNIVSPYRIDLAFNKMIMPASSAAGEDFDKLMVPFRCDASDVYNKKTVVFKSGNLAFAVRASMTIPAVFKPMVYDTLLLYDGGLYNNFPWQTLKEDFNPDILIGGICAGNYKNPINSDIVGQLSVMMTIDTDYTLPDSTDIIIQRHFTDVEVLDYQKATYIMACGYEDAMRQMPKILKKIKRRVSPEEIAEKRRAFKAKIKPLIYEKVEIEGLSPEQTDYIYRQLDVRGDRYLMSAEAFEERYMRILASDIFTGDFPQVTFNPETGYYRIKVTMHTQPSVKISLGGNLSPTSLNMMYIGLQYRTVTNAAMTYGLNAYLGTYYNSVDVGIRHDIFTRFPFFIEYFLGYESTDNDTKIAAAYYENQSWRSVNHYNYFVGGKLAVPLFKNSAARINVSLGQMSDTYYPTYHTSQDDPCKSEFWYGALSVEAQNQSLNFSIYPTAGASRLLQLQFRAGIENYTPGTLSARESIRRHNRSWFMARYAAENYLHLGKTFTLGYMFDVAVSNHPNFSDQIATAITQPAFTPTPLSQVLFMPEYRSASYLAAGIMPIINFSQDKKFYLKSYLYGFLPQELVYDNGWHSLTGDRLSDYYRLIFGTTLVYQTIIGPASLNVAKFTTGPRNWNVVLNMGFNLFSTRRY